MLHVTDAAAEMLKEIRDQIGAPDEAGVRIERRVNEDRQEPVLGLAFSDQPYPEDQVVEQAEIKVFVPEELAVVLSEATLDVSDTPQGRVLTLR